MDFLHVVLTKHSKKRISKNKLIKKEKAKEISKTKDLKFLSVYYTVQLTWRSSESV
jgi:hypothetical protein